MIKVMVAEDEKPISRSIAKAIESTDPQFSVEFVAYNGRQAKGFLDSEKIDVVFLDINMPIYDGLWLLEYIDSGHIDVISVILTGYHEFEYAQRALKARAFDYLLKPLNETELTKILRKVKIEIERKDREMILKVKSDVPHSVFENQDNLRNRCWIASCYIGGYSKGTLLDETLEKQKLTEKHIGQFLEDKFGKNSFWLADGHYDTERILFINAGILNYKEVLEELVESIQFPEIPITIVVGTRRIEIKEINIVYKALCQTAKKVMLFDKSGIQYVECGKEKRGLDVQQDEKKWSMLLDGIWANITVDGLADIFDNIMKMTGLKRHHVEYAVKSFFIRLCEKVPTQISYLELEEEIELILENEFQYDKLRAGIRDIIKEYFYVEVEPVENRKELASALKEYVDFNYQFQFSNQLLEEKFGYSAFYLRSVFKELYRMSPNDYLLKVRMEKACKLLKKNIHAKNVAAEVGYMDPLYFSKVFKKYMGCTPKEYRDN